MPCIQRLLQLAPCWSIFDCEVKEKCFAYEYAPDPCYKTREKRDPLCSGACEQCAIYIKRHSKKSAGRASSDRRLAFPLQLWISTTFDSPIAFPKDQGLWADAEPAKFWTHALLLYNSAGL